MTRDCGSLKIGPGEVQLCICQTSQPEKKRNGEEKEELVDEPRECHVWCACMCCLDGAVAKARGAMSNLKKGKADRRNNDMTVISGMVGVSPAQEIPLARRACPQLCI